MKLSIITVNLNNLDGLKRTIDSVICQTFTNYEWIVIDGGSTDGSRELIEQYQDRFAYWCSEPDKGIYNAMNKGISHARGEWLQFLNSGDWLCDITTLESVFSRNYECDVLYGNTCLIGNNGKTLIRFPETLRFSWLFNDALNHQSSFYKLSIFKEIKYDESFKIIADRALNIELILRHKLFKNINQFIVFFDTNGLSHSNSIFFEEMDLLRQKYLSIHLQDDIDYVNSWKFIENRKTLRFLKTIFFVICKFINWVLHKIETLNIGRKK